MNIKSNAPFSVTELNHQLRGCIENFFGDIVLRAEIGSWNDHNHIYLTLKDHQSSIEAVIWASTRARLSFIPNVGDEVIVRGRISTKRYKSICQYIVNWIEPSGEGLMKREFDRICKKLKEEGLFNRKRPLPLIPRAIGLVTSKTSAAAQDFFKTASMRAPGIPIYLESATMQGEHTVQSIKSALLRLIQHKNIDVIALTRGGGSKEDLWIFNNEELARFIFGSPVPIVVGIGHQSDTLISELVADVRGHTPTGVADLVIPKMDHLSQELRHQIKGLNVGINRLGQHYNHRLSRLIGILQVPRNFQDQRQRLEMTLHHVDDLIRARLSTWRRTGDLLREQLQEQAPHVRITRARAERDRLEGMLRYVDPIQSLSQRLEDQIVGLQRGIKKSLDQAEICWRQLGAQLHALSPLAVLSRGYSITTDEDGHVIHNAQALSVGDQVQISLSSGSVVAQITQVIPKIEETHREDS